MKNKHKILTKEKIINNPQLLLNKFFYFKSRIDDIEFSAIYYFYKIDNEFIYFYKTEHYNDETNEVYVFYKKIELKWMKDWLYCNFNKLF